MLSMIEPISLNSYMQDKVYKSILSAKFQGLTIQAHLRSLPKSRSNLWLVPVLKFRDLALSASELKACMCSVCCEDPVEAVGVRANNQPDLTIGSRSSDGSVWDKPREEMKNGRRGYSQPGETKRWPSFASSIAGIKSVARRGLST